MRWAGNAFDLGRLPHERRTTLKDLLKYLTAPLAFVFAFAIVGAPSAPVAEVVVPSTGDAHALSYCGIGPMPPCDADGDGIPDSQDECPADATNTCNSPGAQPCNMGGGLTGFGGGGGIGVACGGTYWPFDCRESMFIVAGGLTIGGAAGIALGRAAIVVLGYLGLKCG